MSDSDFVITAVAILCVFLIAYLYHQYRGTWRFPMLLSDDQYGSYRRQTSEPPMPCAPVPCVREPHNCPKIGDDYFGLDYDIKTNISIVDCSKACENDSRCKVWGYNTKDRKCYLKQGISTDIVKAPDMVSYIMREYFS